MKRFKNVVISVSLDTKCLEELLELKKSDILTYADNIYFVHIYGKESEIHVPDEIRNHGHERIEEFILQKLHNLAESLIPGHLNHTGQRHSHCLFNSNAKIKILSYLEEIKANLVIAPTRGEQGMEGIFKDSYAFWLVEHAPCDVLVIRPHKK